MSERCITIYTDASYCASSKIGAWACWVRTDVQRFLWADKLKSSPSDCTDAEIKAIANALDIVVRKLKPENKILVVVTDSQESIDIIEDRRVNPVFTGKKKERRQKAWDKAAPKREVAARIRKSIPAGCELRLRKVKAHSNKDGARSYINQLVDKAARRAMRTARKELQTKPLTN